MASPDPVRDLLSFSEEVGNLKDTERRGWVLKGIQKPESVADHMYRMAVLAQTLSPIPNCDMDKVVRMCLVHDLAECRVGDITPHDNVPVDVKHEMERTAITGLTALLTPAAGSALMQLYHEYEQHESVEAKLTKDLDIFDFVHQAFVYEKQAVANGVSAHSLQLEHFVRAADQIKDPQVKQLADRLLADRQLFLRNQEPRAGDAQPVSKSDTS